MITPSFAEYCRADNPRSLKSYYTWLSRRTDLPKWEKVRVKLVLEILLNRN